MKSPLLFSLLAVAAASCLPSARAGVIINEIMYHPASELNADEWLELFNNTAAPAAVGGWQFTKGVRFTIPAGTTIAANGFLVVAADAARFHVNYPAVTNYVGGWSGILSNSSDDLVLTDANGVTVNEVTYADDGDWGVRRRDYFADWGHRGWGWDSPADGGQNATPVFQSGTDPFQKGRSLELINPNFNNTTGQNWLASTPAGGTPGAPNSVIATDIAPVLLNAAHFPLVPKSSDPITVTALVQNDDASIPAVTLHWRVCAPTSPYSDPPFTSVTMLDDGTQGDALPNDRVYGAVLPAQANGAIVEFYFEARDGANHVRYWPAPALDQTLAPAQSQNCLLQVDDTAYGGALPIYRIVMKPADKAELNQINRNSPSAPPYPYGPGETADDQTYSHAEFNTAWITTDGTGSELHYLAGTRNRGHGSRRLQPQGMSVDFPNADVWKKAVSINLNTQYTYSQLFGSALLRKAGLPCPESRQVQVRVNATDPTQDIVGSNSGASNDFGHSLGFYVANEVQDSEFAAHDFPLDSSGNVYRAQRYDFSVPPNTMSEADLSYRAPAAGQQPPDPYRTVWFKHTNTAQDDWTDLIALTKNLALGHSDAGFNTTYDPGYQTALEASVNVDEWMNFLACQTIIDNSETNISNGYGDDFYLYMGITDPRAQFVCYDLDTICGQGDTAPAPNAHDLWRMVNKDDSAGNGPTVLNSFLKFPAFAPLYFQSLEEQLNTTFLPAHFNALCENLLTGVAPGKIGSIETFNTQRTAYLATLIPLTISVTAGPAALDGYPHTTTAAANLAGKANAITTRSVAVNGVAATWSAWQATWTAANVALVPGINRVLIQAYDASGVETERLYYDVWYDRGSVTSVSGAVAGNTLWTPAGGPYQVTANLTIGNGATLTIQPGTTVYLNSGVNISIANGGALDAEGSDTAWIRFTRSPTAGGSWGNLTINGAVGSPQSKLAYIDFQNNVSDANTPCIEVAGGFVLLDHLAFGVTGSPYVHLDSAAFLISNCIFPTTTAAFEPLHGTGGVRNDHYGIVRDNFFGTTTGYNDIMDFTGGNREDGQQIIQYYNNVVIGASDDMFDLDGTDAWVEHNIFVHAHQNGSPDSSSAISGGSDSSSGALRTSEITIIGNLIFDCDQVADAKEGNFFTLINNTIVHMSHLGGTDTAAGVVIDQDFPINGAPTALGKGFYMNGNIVIDAEQLVRNYDSTKVQVTWDNNILPYAWNGPGTGNRIIDPRLTHVPQVTEANFATFQAAQVLRQWFALLPGSPAIGAGPLGRDQGGVIPIGASVSGAPAGTTNQTGATLAVGPVFTGNGIPAGGFPNGSGYTHYQYRLDGGAWNAETPVTTPITLSGLANGPHQVEVIGKNDAGLYQNDPLLGPDATITQSNVWIVDTSYVPPAPAPLIRINEVMAKNTETRGFSGTFPDIAELYNAGNASGDLSGWGLTDNPSIPYKYTFPSGTMLGAGQYLVVYLSSSNNVPQPRTGFALKDQGDSLTLTKPLAQGGAIADVAAFGPQLPDFSVGRRPADGVWDMCVPTFGSANIVAAQGSPAAVAINEWLASAQTLYANDFIELYNPSALPVNLGGCYLTDNPTENITESQIPPLSFIPAGGYALFQADGNSGTGELSFKLSATQGEIGFFDPAESLIDSIIYGPQTTDVSQGRTPDGSATIAFFTQPTPGGPNPGSTSSSTTTTTTTLVPISATWRYDQTDTSAPANWTTPGFNDSSWPSGGATLAKTGANTGTYSQPVVTALSLGSPERSAYYFRTHFTFSGTPSGAQLQITHLIDDGCIAYLNGTEIYRYNMPAGAVTYSTLASTTISANTTLGPFNVPNTNLVAGDNVLAVEVHQVNLTSSDITMAVKLDSTVTSSGAPASDGVVLNEVLALNQTLQNPDGSYAGWIELYNPGSSAADLSDLSLSNNVAIPRLWIFAAGTTIPAGGYLVIYCNPLAAVSATNAGFALSSSGGGVFLFHKAADGGGLQDGVTYGTQIVDFSIARSPNGSGQWALGLPSLGALNLAAAITQPTAVKINEWLTGPGAGWFELFNAGSVPASLGGNYLTDNLTNRTKFPLPPLSFIGAAGSGRWQQVIADNDNSATPGHVNFSLNPAGEAIGLFAAAGTQLEAVSFGVQMPGISQGRFPDGSATIAFMPPTPAATNLGPAADSDGDGIPDIWEILYGLDPHNPADAALDSDGDGQSNLAEYLAGTDPHNPNAVFHLTLAPGGAGGFHLQFTAQPNIAYTIQYKSSLNAAAWTHLTDIAAQASAHAVDYVDTPTDPQRFYRVVTPVTP